MADNLQVVRDEDVPEPTQDDVDVIYTQPSIRVLQTWRPQQIVSAIASSDSGYMSFAAELCDNLIADEIIGGALETRTGGLQGLPLDFRDGRGDEAGDSPLAPELEEDWYHMFPEAETKQLAAWGLILGVGFGEQVWGEFNGRVVPRLKIWHPKDFTYNYTISRWQVRVGSFGDEQGGLVTIQPDDPKWVVYTPYGEHRPWARGLWRGLARWWLLKNYAINDMGEHGEKASLLVVTATGDRSPTVEQRREMAAELHNLGSDGIASLPTGFDIKLVEAKADLKALYISQIEAADLSFVISINGQNLTTNVSGGSFSAASVHERVESRRIRTDGETLSTTLRSQSLVYWTEWNFGSEAVSPWPHWDTDPPADQLLKAKVFDMNAAALVRIDKAGFEVEDMDEFSEESGIPALSEKEVDDPPPAGTPPGTGGTPEAVPPSGAPSAPGEPPEGQGEPAVEARLASGQPVAQAGGFLDGQLYADSLSDWAVRIQAKEFRGPDGFVNAVVEALDISDDYDAIRAAVIEAYADEATPDEIAATLEKIMTMARRAGQVAVDQDA